MTAQRYLVSGRVQGVGFRWFAARTARRLGVTGFVRNLDDGRVEVVASGPGTALEELATALAQGPPAARVTSVDASAAADHEPGTGDFSIR